MDGMELRKKVILDVDTGSDDAVAILLAVLSGKLDVLGITVTWGNRCVEDCVSNTLQVVEMLGADIPVYKGCPAPMVRELTPGRVANNPINKISIVEDGVEYSIHPAKMPLPDAVGSAQPQHACSFLVDTLRNATEKVTLIPVGPATNIGMAFRMDPSIAEKVEEVVFMGGSVGMGNVTPVAEANFFHDPEAVKIILDSGVKVRIVPLNATHSAMLTIQDADELIALGTKAGKLAGEMVKIRAAASLRMGATDGTAEPIHDALAVAWVLDDTVMLDAKRQHCDIDINGGVSDGQLIPDQRGGEDPNSNVVVGYKADKDKFFAMLKENLAKGPRV